MRIANVRNILLIILISLLFLWPLFKPGFYQSHDGEVHVARFAAYYKAYEDGQIPPRWTGDLNYGYGSPLPIFFYPLPYYLGSLLHFLGFELEDTFKILIGTSFLLVPLSFYVFASKLFKQELAFIGALLYGLLPYHFLDIYVRGDIGEMMSFVFVPLVLLFIEKMLEKQTVTLILLGSISYALLILSHHGVALIFTPIFLIYSALRARKKKYFFQSSFMLVLGLLFSAYFWVPALYESRYIQKSLFASFFKEHFITISQIIYSPWGFGPDVNKEGGLSPQIGPVLFILVLVVACRGLLKKQMIMFWFSVFLVGLFFSNNISSFLWERISLLADLQFPWRFTAIIGFASVLLACYGLEVVRSKKLLNLIVFLAVVMSLYLVKINESMKKGDEYYLSFQGIAYHHGEATTIWTAGDPGQKAAQPVEVIAGEASVSEVIKKSNIHTFTVDAKTESRILNNTIYFPGWRVEVDGKKVPIEFQDISHRGLITFPVPKGQHKIEVKFGESPIRLFSDIISTSALIFIVALWVFRKKLNYF